MSLLRFFMIRMLTAASAELPKLQTFSRRLLVLGCYVVAALAIRALQHNIVTRHNVISDFRLPISNLKASHRLAIHNWQSAIELLHHFRDGTGSNRSATFANGEAQAFLHSNGRD